MNPHRLYRCRHDQRISGVAAGVAEYFDLDPSLVRVLWVISVFFGGFTILVYIAMALIVPVEPETMPAAGPWQPGSEAWGASQEAPAEAGATDSGATSETGAGSVQGNPARADWHARYERRRGAGWVGPAIGILLIVIGATTLADQLWPWWNTAWVWPALILAAGVALIARSVRTDAGQR